MNSEAQYRHPWINRQPAPSHFASAQDIPEGLAVVSFSRHKASHRGIARCSQLKELRFFAANQDALDEIGSLVGLEYLELAWPLTAKNLSPLRALRNLRHLVMDSPRNVSDFTAVLDLPLLKRLFIENAKHLLDLDWLRPMAKQLDVLGIEGSNWTTQRIASLTPLEGFSVKALFMTNTRLTDRNLLAAAALPNLRYFAPSAFFPKAEFMKLKALCPAMECSWFDEKNWEKLEALVAAAKQSRPDR